MANTNNETNNTILDEIKERSINIETFTNAKSVQTAIDDALKTHALKERALRESTLTIKNSPELDTDRITSIIEEEWIKKSQQAPVTYWQDKLHTYVQFINNAHKTIFIEKILAKKSQGDELLGKLPNFVNAPNSHGQHITRKEVRLEITNVRAAVKADKIDNLLKTLPGKPIDALISTIREGKLHGPPNRQTKSLMFKVNQDGFKLIFEQLGGSIPYINQQSNIKIRLFPRINVRPWSCRDCAYIGPNHKCEGRTCNQCGLKEHSTKDCKSKTRFCSNCKRRGHRARDLHCPSYIREVEKEIRRMDIPLEYYEQADRRFELIKSLILK